MKKFLILVLFFGFGATTWAESLPTLVVRPHPVDISFPAEAVVEAVHQATVAAQVSGRVVEMRADAGQVVKKGDVLLRIDSREAAEGLRAAEARYLDAKAAYDRSRSLLQQKFVSQAAVDKAKAELDAAAANRAAAAAGQSHTAILAPMAGIVARRHAELGEMAAPGRALFTLYEPGALRVTAQVPQYRLGDMKSVKKARVEFPDLGQWVDGTGVTVLPTVDDATHVFLVRVGLPDDAGQGARWTPGMAARVHFVVGQAEKLTVPASAVVRRGEVAAVYVLSADQRPVLRQMRLGEAVGQGEIEVLAGLRPGETVVLAPARAAIQLKSSGR